MGSNWILNFAGLHLLLPDDVISQLGEDEIPRLKNVLPRLHGLAAVRQAFAPNVHGAAVLRDLTDLDLLIWDHVAATLVWLHYLLEKDQVLVLNTIHVWGQILTPLLDGQFDCLFEVLVEIPGLTITLDAKDVVLIQMVAHLLDTTRVN